MIVVTRLPSLGNSVNVPGMTNTLTELAEVAERLVDLHRDRDRLIVAARAEGFTLREIGEACGLSHPGVSKILQREGN